MFKVFYSWQSDLPGRTNRNLILTSLEKACSRLKSESGVLAEAVVDRDTLGLPGAPLINEAILSKIRDSDAFVADVSLVNATPPSPSPRGSLRSYAAASVERIAVRLSGRTAGARATPNPNVLTELRYAMANLGNEALVLVVNTYYGKPDDLPFDIRHLRTLPYCAGPSDDVGAVKKELERDLAKAIKNVGGTVRGDPVDALLHQKTLNVVGQAQGLFFALAHAANVAASTATEAELIEQFRSITPDELTAICEKVNPNATAPLLLAPTGPSANWLQYLGYVRKRSSTFTNEIMAFSPLLKREHAALLMRVEHSFYFKQLEFLKGPIANPDLTWISDELFRYFGAALELERYAQRELARRARAF